jgi:hypothetical protein
MEYWNNGVLGEYKKNQGFLFHQHSNIPPFHYFLSCNLLETSAVTWQTRSAKTVEREAVPQLGVMIAL